jgi:hypothetical protein
VVLTAHTGHHENPSGGVTGTYSFDIVANDVAVRRDSSADPALIRLAQGVVDTNAEAMLASDMTGESSAKNRDVSGVSEMYAQSAGQGVKWVTLRSATDPAWQVMRVEADARARVIHDLSNGYVVVAPNRPVTMGGRQVFGWWRVDPKDGASLGLRAQGLGHGNGRVLDHVNRHRIVRSRIQATNTGGTTQRSKGSNYDELPGVGCFRWYVTVGAGRAVLAWHEHEDGGIEPSPGSSADGRCEGVRARIAGQQESEPLDQRS